jgi:hypothetical protein
MFTKLFKLYESKYAKHNRLNEQLTVLKRKVNWARKERQERHKAYVELEADPLTTVYEQNSMKRSLGLLDDSINENIEKMNEIEAELLSIEY